MSVSSSTDHYFSAHHEQLNVWGHSDEGFGLRECQLGAYWAVWSHFTTSESPALVSLPTGAGKTALMTALAFGLKARRVLVVTPAQILRDQVHEAFSQLNVLKKIGVLPVDLETPRTMTVVHMLKSPESWAQVQDFDVVVATPKTISPLETKCAVPDGLFDLVFIDEAHHVNAPTWEALLRAAPAARCVLLTATPFRRDRRRIPVPLVYHYSIGRALTQGIYEPVEYHAVTGGTNQEQNDRLLAKEAKVLRDQEQAIGHAPRLLIRANGVDRAGALVKVYAEQGLNVREVDYTKSLRQNQQVVDDVRQGTLDGVVCVGMLGEGLDLPALKIAVLHDAPRSLPFTIQFMGRVCRLTGENPGPAHLLSIPEDAKGEVRRLHRYEADWRKLVPKLADILVGRAANLASLHSPALGSLVEIDPADLKPFFTVRGYNVDLTKVDMLAEPEWRDDVQLCLKEQLGPDGPAVFITETEEEPAWAHQTGLFERRLDLHVYYNPPGTELLFECSTSRWVSSGILNAITNKSHSVVAPQKLMNVLKGAATGSYFMVGLRNAVGRGNSNPAYKTFMGAEVQMAVRPTDGKTYAPGHAVASVTSDETRGIGTEHSSIWAIKRDYLPEFRKWCDAIATELQAAVSTTGLPQLGFLATANEVLSLPDRPLAILLEETIFQSKGFIKVSNGGAVVESDIIPRVQVLSHRSDGVLECIIEFHSTEPGIRIEYDAKTTNCWSQSDPRDVLVWLELSDRDFKGNLISYLTEYPPRLVLPGGGVVIRNQHWIPQQAPGKIPSTALFVAKWDGCDITKETKQPDDPKLKNILDWVEAKLIAETSATAVVIRDHKKGELADFIVLEPSRQVVTMYHCKKMSGKDPDDRVTDAYEVLGQSCRSAQWLFTRGLLDKIAKHTRPPRKSPIVKGDATALDSIRDGFTVNTWKYGVVAVQPGFKCDELQDSEKLQSLVVAAFEWLVNSECEFTIWGS